MMFELTLLATFAIHHLVIGLCLYLALTTAFYIYKTTAEMQSWLWMCAFVICTILPLASLVLDTPTPIEIVEQVAVNHSLIDDPQVLPVQLDSSVKPNRFTPQWHVPMDIIYRLDLWLYSLLVIWFLGAIWRTYAVKQTFIRTRTLVSQASAIKCDINQLCDVPILTSTEATTPMAIGITHPIIVLPKSMVNTFTVEQLSPIVLHEYAHIQRNDILLSTFQEILAIIFWWSPVMRLLNIKIYLNRELACDMRAAKQLADHKQYAQSLLDCARLMLTKKNNVMAMGLFSKKKELNFRMEQVMKMKKVATPKMMTVLVSCLAFSFGSLTAATKLSPQISLTDIEQESNHFSKLSRAKGELLMEAIADSDFEIIRIMIRNGLNIDTPIVGDGTALIVAVKRNNTDMVEAFIEMGANVNQSAMGDGNPLIAAAQKGNVSIAKLLLAHGAELDAIVKGDETALINASWQGHFDMVKLLVENGADVNLGVTVKERGKEEYRSPLNKARNSQIKQYLKDNGASS